MARHPGSPRQPTLDDPPLLTYEQVLNAIHSRTQACRAVDQPSSLNRISRWWPMWCTRTGVHRRSISTVHRGDPGRESPTPFDFKAFTRALHGWWLVPFTNGYSWAIFWCPLRLAAAGLVGHVGWWCAAKFWKGFFKPNLRFKHGARIFWGDFHRLCGIWSIWFIAVISISGLWFSIQAFMFDNQISISTEGNPPVVARQDVPIMPDGKPAPQISLDKAVAIAAEKIPGA